jgi:filamin
LIVIIITKYEMLISFTVNASEAGAGNLEIIVAVNGRNVPNYVQSEGNAKFRVNFKPKEAAPHSLSVRFNGEPIPGTFKSTWIDLNKE